MRLSLGYKHCDYRDTMKSAEFAQARASAPNEPERRARFGTQFFGHSRARQARAG